VTLADRTVLLTGATGGLGAEMARALTAQGASLVLTGRRADALEAIAAETGGRPVLADLAEPGAAEALVREAGRVDVLIANAALPASGLITSFSVEEIDRALMVNLRTPMILGRLLGEAMADRGEGHLVFVSSLSGKVASVGASVYSATKFGLRGFAAGLREDLPGTGVGVTVVYPGFVSEAGMFAESRTRLPRGVGTVTPEQVADAVVRGIESGRAEIDVAPLGLRAGVLMGSLAPVTAGRVQRRLGSARIADEMSEGQRAKR
jgi:short-subunit dehydrogenase